MSTAQLDPHNKMRSRDVNKVARGEQAPRPPHEYGHINSAPPRPSSTPPPPPPPRCIDYGERIVVEENPISRHCYEGYLQYHRCIKKEGKDAPKCKKFEKNYILLCPVEWIERWEEEQKQGVFAGPL